MSTQLAQGSARALWDRVWAGKAVPRCSVTARHRAQLARRAGVDPGGAGAALAAAAVVPPVHVDLRVHVTLVPAAAPAPLTLWRALRRLAWD